MIEMSGVCQHRHDLLHVMLQESMTMRNQLLEKQLPQAMAAGDGLPMPAPPSAALGEPSLAGPGAALD